jgi:hypothetical protein
VKHPDKGWLVVRPHPEEGPRVKAAIADVLAGESQYRAAQKLGIAPSTFRELLRNPRLYGQAPGGKLDTEAGIITMFEWRRLQQTMTRGGGTKSRAPGYGKALVCSGCQNRMYYASTHALPRDRYQCRLQHPRKVAILADDVNSYVEDWFLSRYGDAPMVTAVWSGEDDTGRLEALAGVEVELDDVSKALVRPGAEIAKLAKRAEALHAERERLLEEPEKGEWVPVPTGETMRQHWVKSSDDERTTMLLQVAKFVIHPRGRKGGRIEAIPHPHETEDVDRFVMSPEDLEWLHEQGLAQ